MAEDTGRRDSLGLENKTETQAAKLEPDILSVIHEGSFLWLANCFASRVQAGLRLLAWC